MKSFTIAVVILCVMIVGMFVHTIALSKAEGELIRITEHIEESVKNKNWNKLSGEVESLCKSWDEMSVWLSCVIEHEEIDNIMVSVASIREYARYREIPELMAELSSLCELINHIPLKEKPMPQNIL